MDQKNEVNIKPVSLSEVKNILKKVEKDREELLYEQRIALEHANMFTKLSFKNTEELIKDLSKLDFLKEKQIYKITDILPITEDDVKTIFAKERGKINDNEIKQILDIIKKYYIK